MTLPGNFKVVKFHPHHMIKMEEGSCLKRNLKDCKPEELHVLSSNNNTASAHTGYPLLQLRDATKWNTLEGVK